MLFNAIATGAAMSVIYTFLIVLGALALLLLAFDRLAPTTAARLGIALERRRAGLRVRTFQSGSANMPYLEGGSGDIIVLVHGFGGDKDNFTRSARFLTGSWRVLIPDLPGFGEASRESGAGYTIADQVEHLRLFLQAIGEAPVHLGGNSMGGFIAAEFAARYPDKVASLWLLDAAGTAAAFENEVFRHYHRCGDMPLLLRSPKDIKRMLQACTFRPLLVPYSVKLHLGKRGAADYALHADILRQVHLSPLLEHQFSTIAAPALIVWGEQDAVLNPAGAAALHGIFPASEVVMMPGVGHLPMLESPRRCSERYIAFLMQLTNHAVANTTVTA
jgi:pimeloyl-ACP methyl ester carboxylesterase